MVADCKANEASGSLGKRQRYCKVYLSSGRHYSGILDYQSLSQMQRCEFVVSLDADVYQECFVVDRSLCSLPGVYPAGPWLQLSRFHSGHSPTDHAHVALDLSFATLLLPPVIVCPVHGDHRSSAVTDIALVSTLVRVA